MNGDILTDNALIMLPVGDIKPEGWLKDQLIAQKNSLTGHLDDFWPDLMQSAWRGKEGESWERGPDFVDGLVPLGYLFDDEELKTKVDHWMSFILNSQQENGWFGPEKNSDRWPLAVALKVLKQYYEGSGDEKALTVIKNYFNYLYSNEPDWPDDAWRGVRAMENAVTGYWLYRQTGDSTLLEVVKSIHDNCRNWTDYFVEFPWDSKASEQGIIPDIWDATGLTAHVVNIAMAVKYPGIWYQQSGDTTDLTASFDGIEKLDFHHGQLGGRFSGDEHVSGTKPTQGTEMCAIVEYMFSLEQLIEITGSNELSDRLELLAFNSLPGTQTPDGWGHQYDQQSNQVLVSNDPRNWSSNRDESNVFGVEPNFGCCTANMHQGWPKLVQSLWMATTDGGLAAVSYAPCSVSASVGNGQNLEMSCATDYPFKNQVLLSLKLDQDSRFPLILRIPGWCKAPQISINGEKYTWSMEEKVRLIRNWKDGDQVEMVFPMPLEVEKRYNQAVAIKRGPLYFSLRIDKTYYEEDLGAHSHRYIGATDWGIRAASPWNYGLILDQQSLENSFEVVEFPVRHLPFADRGDKVYMAEQDQHMDWEHNPPLVITARGKQIPGWGIVDHSAGDTPLSPVESTQPVEKIELIPYAAAKLRVSEFPVIK